MVTPRGIEPRLHPSQGCVLSFGRQSHGALGWIRTIVDRLRADCSTFELQEPGTPVRTRTGIEPLKAA